MNQNITDFFKANWTEHRQEKMSIDEYLALCARDQMAYATAAERMVAAIGEPEKVDTTNDRLDYTPRC